MHQLTSRHTRAGSQMTRSALNMLLTAISPRPCPSRLGEKQGYFWDSAIFFYLPVHYRSMTTRCSRHRGSNAEAEKQAPRHFRCTIATKPWMGFAVGRLACKWTGQPLSHNSVWPRRQTEKRRISSGTIFTLSLSNTVDLAWMWLACQGLLL